MCSYVSAVTWGNTAALILIIMKHISILSSKLSEGNLAHLPLLCHVQPPKIIMQPSTQV